MLDLDTTKQNSLKLEDQGLFKTGSYVAGQWRDAASGKTISVTNPATGEELGTVPAMETADVRSAITAANAALPAWRRRTAKERAKLLSKVNPCRNRWGK
jgi:succinate-semialdehyde dehydrogenase/glutarate-semialdehyde dehydrogenase